MKRIRGDGRQKLLIHRQSRRLINKKYNVHGGYEVQARENTYCRKGFMGGWG